jgi:hypothetical protein
MSIGNTDVDFKEIYDAINGAGAHTTQAIGMDSFYNQPFDDGTSTPSSGAISIGDMKGKTKTLYGWEKLDGIWTTANGTNCGRALEIGWFGNVHTNNSGIPTGSSAAEQIQNIKDWLEEKNAEMGYTYYIGFSFHASYPTLPQVCKRTNGPDGAISEVSGLSTSYNSTWDLYYISNVFDIPNGIGNPLKGKTIDDVIVPEIEIPSGDPSPSSGGSTWSGRPFNTYYHDNRYQAIYPASELTAGGMVSNQTIKSVQFKITQQPGRNIDNLKIGYAWVSSTTFSGWVTVSHYSQSTTYDNTSTAVNKWTQPFVFTTTGSWNGSDHLLIEYQNDGTGYTTGGSVEHKLAGNGVIASTFNYTDNGSPNSLDYISSNSENNAPLIKVHLIDLN